jgi:hypothetical protein
VVQLADQTGASINVSWQGGGSLSDPMLAPATVQRYTDVIKDLVTTRGIKSVQWVSMQNEVNTIMITMAQYEAVYRLLDADLRAAGIRDQVKIACGDLLWSTKTLAAAQGGWLDYTARNMADICDAYTLHIYFRVYTLPDGLEKPLVAARQLMDSLPAAMRRPLQVTEYSASGLDGDPRPGLDSNGNQYQTTIASGLQHLWFNILAARLGYSGTAKWDAYYAKYDNGVQRFYMLGEPADGWPRWPTYHAIRMLTHGMKRGWSIVSVEGSTSTALVTAFRGPLGETAVLGLNRNAGARTISITGLPPGTPFYHLAWNYAGGGGLTTRAMEMSTAGCKVSITVPPSSGFLLTTEAPNL